MTDYISIVLIFMLCRFVNIPSRKPFWNTSSSARYGETNAETSAAVKFEAVAGITVMGTNGPLSNLALKLSVMLSFPTAFGGMKYDMSVRDTV